MAPVQRNEKFQLRVTAEERKMLEALAEKWGFSASDTVRQLIRRAFDAEVTTAPKKPKR